MNKPIYIKKNYPELRGKIENLGYKLKKNSVPEVDNCICIVSKGLYMTFFDLLGNCPVYGSVCIDKEEDFFDALKEEKYV